MKLYSRKFADKAIYRRTRVKTESRDAILWNIDWDNRICNVKIQGSNELIAAHFPQNLAALDPFMKEGNAVRIIHRGGIRGFVEVIGHGMAIPTPVTGATHPTTSELADGIIIGMQVYPTDPASMDVQVEDGTYRINGVTYSLSGGAFGVFMDATDPMKMTDPYSPAIMGDADITKFVMTTADPVVMSTDYTEATMGDVYDTYTIDAPPGGNTLRYDTFYVGIDGIIHYLKGNFASSNPTKPSIPVDTVQIGEYILIWTGMTEVTGQNIGMEYEVKTPSDILITTVDEMSWDTDETNVAITVKDQYGWNIAETYNAILQLVLGSGEVWSGDSGYNSDLVSQQFNGTGYTFKYKRNPKIIASSRGNETSPYMMVQIVEYNLSIFGRITLIGVFGEEVAGNEIHENVQILESAADIEIDWSDGAKAEVEAEEDITFTFTGTPEMEKLILKIIQDSTGGWEITLPAKVKYGTEITTAAISTDANTRSYLGFLYDSVNDEYDLVANVSGYPAT